MKEYNIDNIAVLIGIDCAHKKHDICEHHNHTEIYNYSIIKHKPQALHEWTMDLNNAIQNKKSL